MLKIENVSYTIGKTKILKDISFECQPGKLNIILGPNGAGKTSLLKLITSENQKYSGKITYNTKLNSEYSVLEMAKQRAVLSQNIDLAFPMTVFELVMMGRYPHFKGKPSKIDYHICEEIMDFINISDFRERDYLTLSGGEKQRVHFARVLAQIWDDNNQSKFLFLDEPLTYLDIQYQLDFMNKILKLTQTRNWIVLGIIHDLNLAAKFADQIILIQNGQLISKGNKNEVLTIENIKNVYNLEPKIFWENENMYISF